MEFMIEALKEQVEVIGRLVYCSSEDNIRWYFRDEMNEYMVAINEDVEEYDLELNFRIRGKEDWLYMGNFCIEDWEEEIIWC